MDNDYPVVEQATAAPGEKRSLIGWRFDGEETVPPTPPVHCPVCGSADTWVEWIDVGFGQRRVTGYRHCRSCAGPGPIDG